MVRTKLMVAAALAALALAAWADGPKQDNKTLKLGETYEGEHKGTKESVNIFLDRNFFATFSQEGVYKVAVPIELKAGQKVSLSVTATGSGRRIALALQDPANDFVASHTTAQFKDK